MQLEHRHLRVPAFAKWVSTTWTIRAEAEQGANLSAKCARLVRRWKHARLALGWRGWSSAVQRARAELSEKEHDASLLQLASSNDRKLAELTAQHNTTLYADRLLRMARRIWHRQLYTAVVTWRQLLHRWSNAHTSTSMLTRALRRLEFRRVQAVSSTPEWSVG